MSEHQSLSPKAAAFTRAMDKLWEDHITWTRMVIVDFAAGLPDLKQAEARLLRNQANIGNAIKPYYGAAQADQAPAHPHPRGRARAHLREGRLSEMNKMMKRHLALTTAEGVARIQGHWKADIAAYDKVHLEILQMSQMLSNGIISQFPDRF